MSPFCNFNDKSSAPPRLRVGTSLWSLEKLPLNAPVEWTLDEKMARVVEAGFEYVECYLPTEELRETVPPVVKKHGLELTLVHRGTSVEATREVVAQAATLGAGLVVCQPASAYHSLAEVVEIVRAGAQMAAESGICYFVETHRNNFTESIRQTLELIEAVPEIQITSTLR